MDFVFQRCIHPACAATAALDDTTFRCARCGGLLDVAYDWNRLPPPKSLKDFEAKWSDRANPLSFSGVWRFRELLPFAPPEAVLTIGEGQTILQKAVAVANYVGLQPGRLFLQYEGMNPSGSFKDNGMTAAFTPLPVFGVPVQSKTMSGQDSLLSIVQMPGGIPVGTLAIGKAGAINAALLAAAVLALSDEDIADRLDEWRERQSGAIAEYPMDDR